MTIKNYQHNLKTLYQWLNRHNRDLLSSFDSLQQYCYFSEWGETGSLRWLIYKLRKQIDRKELQQLFLDLLREAKETGKEQDLYTSVLSFTAAKRYAGMIEQEYRSIE